MILNGKIVPFMIDTGARFTTLNGHVSATDLSETAAVVGLVVGFPGHHSLTHSFLYPQNCPINQIRSSYPLLPYWTCDITQWSLVQSIDQN